MKKIIFFILSILLFQFSYSQTIEITKITVSSAATNSVGVYTNPEINLYSNQIPYEATKIEFSWADFDQSNIPPNTSFKLALWVNDGSSKTNLVSTSYFLNSSNYNYSNYVSAAGNFITDGRKEYTLKVTFFDVNNNEQFVKESKAWIVKIIPTTNQISGNLICCDQTTLSYPFDPVELNQRNGYEISTADGATISTIQWQKQSGNNWNDIPGATQLSYDPPSINTDAQYRRVLTSSSGAVNSSYRVSVRKITEKIMENSVCCSQTTGFMPFDPSAFTQKTNTNIYSNVETSTFTYQWQDSTNGVWANISGATNSMFDPSFIKNSTGYRRIVFSSNGSQSISNTVTVLLRPCERPYAQQNTICGDQAFYKLQHGDIIKPAKILGAFISPNIDRREFGYDYMISVDGVNWLNVKAKHLLSARERQFDEGPYYLCSNINYTANPEECAILKNELDYQMPAFFFDASKGSTQRLFIRRDYYHWYDEFNCGLFNAFPCGSQWHFRSSSNTVTITLTTGDFPKPVPPIASSRDNATCKWSDQTINFSVPQLNNQEYYKWEIPASWTSYTALEGPYANQISINTNSAEKNLATGGEVCLTVTQGNQSNRQCKTIKGTLRFFSIIPTSPIAACEGQTVILKPTLISGEDRNPDNYKYNWAAYQSISSCNNHSDYELTNCKELKITVGNVRQNPNQEVTLITTNSAGCIFKSTTKLVTSPGLQMGILNTYDDPRAIANSGLAVNTSSNFLYFTDKNKNIFRSYYDNTDRIWKYIAVRNKNNNKTIRSDGPVTYYKGTIDKLFYILNSNIYYAESTDNGLTWIDYFPSNTVASNVDSRIKTYGNNIYYIDNITRKVFYQAISASNPSTFLVGNTPVNYSQRMFTVEDGILAYADQNNNIVAFNALTGVSLTINVPAQIKQVNYNSSISTYNGNIYYTSSSGALRILKKNTSTGIYDNYEEVSGLQLAGPFAINKQTGTLYAKAYDVLGKQIYYLNNKWNAAPIVNYFSYSSIESDMIYTNGHAYYIGDNGNISNTYYIAPCIPEVLRIANTLDEAGDIINDPLSNTINEDHSVTLYPNPTNNLVKVSFTISQESMVEIKIIPITGGSTDVKYNAPTESGTQDLSLDMSTHAAGIYLVQVYVNGSLYANSKLIKY